MIYKLIGKFLKHRRIKMGFTLREFCSSYGLDPITISAIERGYYFKETPERRFR